MRPEILYPLFGNLENLKGIGEKNLRLLSNLLGGNKISDMIWHLPSNLIDRRYSPPLSQAIPGRVCSIKIKILEHIPPSGHKKPYKIKTSDGTAELMLIFFKAYPESLRRNLPEGSTRYISGKLNYFNGGWQMSHPDYICKNAEDIPSIETIYPLTAGITNKMLAKWQIMALSRVANFPEWQNLELLQQKQWKSFRESLFSAHRPQKLSDLENNSLARSRLAYDELLANQLALGFVRQKIKKQQGRQIKGNGLLRKKIIDNLNFKLTGAQERVLQEIFTDQASPYRMLRLLQGDVGSGKTIVALLTMLNAVECNTQAAIMAPTEILAKQHFETIAPLCELIGIRAELLTGKTKTKFRKELLTDLENGKINILIGTHALFQEDVKFYDLSCVIIDEQHRFGVHQRLGLSNKGKQSDVLVMTATPIPRTLVLTAYGDMEYSKIDEVPAGRKPVDTRVVSVQKINEVAAGLKRKLEQG